MTAAQFIDKIFIVYSVEGVIHQTENKADDCTC